MLRNHILYLICFCVLGAPLQGGQCWYNYISVGAEWLYWNANQSQMELASHVIFTDLGTPNGVAQTTSLRPDFDYSNGYRVFLDYQLSNCWAVEASLTHLPSSPSVSAQASPTLTNNVIFLNNHLYPVQENFFGVPYASFESTWELDLYYLDLSIKRLVCLCKCVVLEPYAGARGLWMKQKITSLATAAVTSMSNASVYSEEFCGGGLMGGVNAQWQWGCGFSLIGKFGSSLIYSKVKNEFDVLGEEAVNALRIFNNNTYYKSHPTIDSFIGVQYARAFCFCSTEVHVGWENHLFFHTNQMSLPSNGDLTLQGLTVGGSFRF